MSYEHKSILETIDKIGRNEVYLPAIQRKFVWKYDQIISLFDSIMRGYPIGTFLFWFVSGEKKADYTFYKFLDEFHERDRYLNDIAPKPELKEEIIGVLDGQQRLSSMYVALQGTYAYKKPYARRDDDSAYPKRKLYLNLLGDSTQVEEDHKDDFGFLTPDEASSVGPKALWFPVREVLPWGQDPAIDDYYDRLLESNLPRDTKDAIKDRRSQIKSTLRILHQRLVLEKLVSYFRIEEPDLDKILDIFVRVNSGGTILSKSDLLFSTIVANWQEGREEIEDFLTHINNKGNGFRFDTDFIMRSCLVLTDSPVLFKVRSFRKENIDRIRRGWENIRSAVTKSVDLLVEFGFNGENLTSQNAIIPMAYYFIKGGRVNETARRTLRKYLIHSLLKQIYGGHGDQVLSSIREHLRKKDGESYVLKTDRLAFEELSKARLPGDKSLKISEDDLTEILEYKKGPYTFMVLSLLYPNLRFDQVDFHQDHIHPSCLFTDSMLEKFGIDRDRWLDWKDMKDRLPNLQLMEGRENESKNRTPIEEWLKKNSEELDTVKFKIDNYFPSRVSLKFKDFGQFYRDRGNMLRRRISQLLL